jgi:WD40 repeat protein
VSASEDGTLKAWTAKNLNTLSGDINNFEPYLTLRGHGSPILSMTGTENFTKSYLDNLVISGSVNGVIKAWNVP